MDEWNGMDGMNGMEQMDTNRSEWILSGFKIFTCPVFDDFNQPRFYGLLLMN